MPRATLPPPSRFEDGPILHCTQPCANKSVCKNIMIASIRTVEKTRAFIDVKVIL